MPDITEECWCSRCGADVEDPEETFEADGKLLHQDCGGMVHRSVNVSYGTEAEV